MKDNIHTQDQRLVTSFNEKNEKWTNNSNGTSWEDLLNALNDIIEFEPSISRGLTLSLATVINAIEFEVSSGEKKEDFAILGNKIGNLLYAIQGLPMKIEIENLKS